MAYLRWSGSDWYVFAHVDGGLAVWSCFAHEEDEDRLPTYPVTTIREFLTADRQLDEIPGWRRASYLSRMELVFAMREFLGDERGEDVGQIGDGPNEPSLRVKLRESIEDDRDHDAWKAEP